MRGRKPTGTVLKMLRGNPGKRPINPNEPQPETLATACPSELTDPDAQKEWARGIVPAIQIGQITAADRCLAILHCDLWATWLSQRAAAAKNAHVVAVGKHEHPIPNPARGMANKTLAMLKDVDGDLGFSPSSRTRVSANKPTAADPLSLLIARARQ